MQVHFYEDGGNPAVFAPTPQEQEALAAMSKGKFRLAMRIWTDVLEKNPRRALLVRTASWDADWENGCVLADEAWARRNSTRVVPALSPTPPIPQASTRMNVSKHKVDSQAPVGVSLAGKPSGRNPNELQPAHVNILRRHHRNQEYDRLAW